VTSATLARSRTGEELRTEFTFVLPRGYKDENGTLHKEGAMRLATARDEIVPQRDPRVRDNEAYLTVILLSRVVTRLGSVAQVTPATIEGLFASDLAYLQRLYERFNSADDAELEPAGVRARGRSLRAMAAVGEA